MIRLSDRPLVCESSKTGNEEDGHLQFFYLLAFLQLGKCFWPKIGDTAE